MIIPSIDLMGGSTVQLVGGREKKLDAGSPDPIAERFAVAGPIAVIDLDAALGTGTNALLIESLCARHRCRVGGGIRSVEAALRWLDAGAEHVILGTAATPDLLRRLPKQRVIAALDSVHNDVVTHGWTQRTGTRLVDQISVLKRYVDAFLVTFVESEGRMTGIDMDRARTIIQAASPARVVIAGGVRSVEDIATLDHMGADAQVGMALYMGAIDLADAIAAPLTTDRPDGLFPTVVTDTSGVALGLAYSSRESLREAVHTRRGVYFSRSRGTLWTKGATSGATQELLAVDVDCDRDTLRFTVRQAEPGFCHLQSRTCWGSDRGLSRLARMLAQRAIEAPPGSYTRRLMDDPALLRAKLIEEAGELADAKDPCHVAEEACDVAYFTLVRAAAAGVSLLDIDRVLDRRSLRVSRRQGDSKPITEPTP